MRLDILKSPFMKVANIELQKNFHNIYRLMYIPCILFSSIFAFHIYINGVAYKYLRTLEFLSLGLPVSVIISSFICWILYNRTNKKNTTSERMHNTKYIKWFYISNNIFRIVTLFAIITRFMYAVEAFLYYPCVSNLCYIGVSTWHIVVFGGLLLILLNYVVCLIPAARLKIISQALA